MGIAATTFAPGFKGASVTLSGSDLIATVSSGTGSVVASNNLSGKTYFEMLLGATLSGSSTVGLASLATSLSALIGAGTTAIGYNKDGTVKINNSNVATIATYAATDNIGVAVDLVKQLIWFRKNGGNWNNDVIGNQNPDGAVGGISIASIISTLRPAWGGSATSSVTAKFASADWTYSAPSGFASIDTLAISGGFNGNVADESATFSQYGAAKAVSGAAVTSGGAMGVHTSLRDQVYEGAWFGGYKLWSLAATQTAVSGVVEELGVPVGGKTVHLYDARTGTLLGSDVSDGSGVFSIPSLGRGNVYAVALDPTYQAIVYDQIEPV